MATRSRDELRRQHEALQDEYARFRAAADADRAAAHARIAELTAEVGRLATLVAQSNERITELLAIAQRNQRGPRRSATKPLEPPPSIDEAARRAFAERPKPPVLPQKAKPLKKPRRPTGRKQVPEHLEAEEHTRYPDACDGCGSGDLEIVGEVVETKLHVVKEHQRGRVVHRKTARCRCCSERTTARSLPAPFARSKATCEWLAWRPPEVRDAVATRPDPA